jgi:hypothetical protein
LTLLIIMIEEQQDELTELDLKNAFNRSSSEKPTHNNQTVPKDLDALADYISRISSTLRLSSKEEVVKLATEMPEKEPVYTLNNPASTITNKAENVGKKASVFLTQIPIFQESKKDTSKKEWTAGLYNAKLVEATVFPGLGDSSLILPNSTSPKDMISLVLNNRKLSVFFSTKL